MPILAAAFVPSAPVLVPELAGAAAAELEGLRAAADAAVVEVCGAPRGDLPVVVLGRGQGTRTYAGEAAGSFRPWGTDVRVGGTEDVGGLPLALTVGAWLLDRARVPPARRTYQSVGPDGVPPVVGAGELGGDLVLVVVGDGSSTRTPKAPGSFHPQAARYDADVREALAAGDPAGLAAAAGGSAAADVGADGAPAWVTAARWWGPERAGSARVDADESPYGVGYLVGVWTRAAVGRG